MRPEAFRETATTPAGGTQGLPVHTEVEAVAVLFKNAGTLVIAHKTSRHNYEQVDAFVSSSRIIH